MKQMYQRHGTLKLLKMLTRQFSKVLEENHNTLEFEVGKVKKYKAQKKHKLVFLFLDF